MQLPEECAVRLGRPLLLEDMEKGSVLDFVKRFGEIYQGQPEEVQYSLEFSITLVTVRRWPPTLQPFL